eukprot:Rhum_TRINITY_DN3429_c0_g1::Rhum_TRINITY_DN3429_c0_g1_i1::g.10787::m.10787
MYQLYLCAEVSGQKLNLDLLFTARPEVDELVAYAEEAVNFEMTVVPALQPRPDEQPRFRAYRLAVYDKALGAWLDLVSAAQLAPCTQLYAFQEQGRCGHVDRQHDLPVPRALTLHREMPMRPCVVRGGGGVFGVPA